MATYMKVIIPLEITAAMVGSPTYCPAENELSEFNPAATYGTGEAVQVVTSINGFFYNPTEVGGVGQWVALCAAPNGDVYAADSASGIVYKRTSGVGNFVPCSPTLSGVSGLAAHASGNIYACVLGGDIYMQTGGTGSFAALSAGTRNWNGMCVSPAGHVYACVLGGDIYKQTSGSGAFNALSTTSRQWCGMTASLGGNIYAGVDGGDIYIQTGGAGAFGASGAGSKNWRQMCTTAQGDIYAAVYSTTAGGIWKQSGGTGAFADISAMTRPWYGICYCPNSDIYAGMYPGNIYQSSGARGAHHLYESLVGSNLGNYPPSDILATTPKWLDLGATNKWKSLDYKTTSQTTKASPIVYVITPGVAVDSIALMGLSMTSYRVQGTSGAYDSGTVSSTATDIVLTNLGGLAANVLTITITNTGGLAKVGEIILGNSYTLGTFRPGPTVGITDYSTKTVDEFGDYTIIERTFSKRMTCAIQIAIASVDAVFNKLAEYRTTPLVWIGSSSYSSLIVYGYYKDFSVVFSSPRFCDCSLEIEGLT